MDMPGGNFQNKGQDYSVNLKGEIQSSDELESMMIPTASGMRPLGQLANINPASEDVRQRVTYFNTESGLRQDNSVLLSIIKSPEGNPVNVADEVKLLIPVLQDILPKA